MAIKYDSSLSKKRHTITREYGQKLLTIAKEKPKKDHRSYVNEALKYLSQKDVDEVFPPPTWQTIFLKQYTGVGKTGGDDPKYNDGGINTFKTNRDAFIGDRYTVIDANFEVWVNGG